MPLARGCRWTPTIHKKSPLLLKLTEVRKLEFSNTCFPANLPSHGPLYRSTCVSRHFQSKLVDFVGAKFYCLHALCWRQTAHSDYGEDAGVLLNSVIYTVSVHRGVDHVFFSVRTHPLFEMNCLLLRLHPTSHRQKSNIIH